MALHLLAVAVFVSATAAGPVSPQDHSVRGDWRYLGGDPEYAYGFDLSRIQPGAAQVTMPVIRVPLGAGASTHEINTVVIDCAAKTYRMTSATTYDADGTAPPGLVFEGTVRPVEGPIAVVHPIACEGTPALEPDEPITAAEFSAFVRSR